MLVRLFSKGEVGGAIRPDRKRKRVRERLRIALVFSRSGGICLTPLVGLLTMDALCVYGVRRLTTHQILLVHYVEWEKDERGDAQMGKWDESNLVLFNLVHHHQEREN